MNPKYAGQNQDSGLRAKKSGVIFFKPKVLDYKHGEYLKNSSRNIASEF